MCSICVCAAMELNCVAVCCSVLQCVAACCNVLQCDAEQEGILNCWYNHTNIIFSVCVCVAVGLNCVATYCSVFQCVAVSCSVLLCDAEQEGILMCWHNHSYIMF